MIADGNRFWHQREKRWAVAVYSQAELNKIARQLNERPRKTLNYDSPAERFNECVASTS